MTRFLPKFPAATALSRPASTRPTKMIFASMLLAGVMAVGWFGAPPIPTLVGVFGTGGLLYWKSLRLR